MASWPGSMPTYAMTDGYQESLPNNVIRTQMDTGPPKSRRRATSAITPLSFMQTISVAQLASIKAFYITTLSYGSVSFTMNHPVTGSSGTFRFIEPPSWASAGGGGYYEISYKLEQLA